MINPKGVLVISSITPYNNGNLDINNEIFLNTKPVDPNNIYYREFMENTEAVRLRAEQNLASRMHFVDNDLIVALAKQYGFSVVESEIVSTKVVSGFILRKE